MIKNKAITSRSVDFAQWYTDVVEASRLASYSNVKGCMIVEPNGCALWESIRDCFDKMLKETGHKNVIMPMFIPESLINKESELIEGFAPEVAWVTYGGSKKLDERLCVRPTSETLFSDYYSSVVKSYRDLPLKYNQWCSVVRWEKETRPFLRTREFFWQEGHTIHSSNIEAEEETRNMLGLYKKFIEEFLAIPVIMGKKTEKEKFAGAEYTLTLESLMYNGVCLQSATSHYFGQKFSKAYNIKFLNKENEWEYAYQTSWGLSSRIIGALIMVHGDDNGLILPPKISPVKVVIIPIGEDKSIQSVAQDIKSKLINSDIYCTVDDSDKRSGFKFASSEVNGIPLRIEVGIRDLEEGFITLARRDTNEKIRVSVDVDIVKQVNDLLGDIQNNLFNKAKERMETMTFEAHSLDDFKKIVDSQPGFIKADWCGSEECELKLKELSGIKSRCILENQKCLNGKCAICGKEAKHLVVWGIQY